MKHGKEERQAFFSEDVPVGENQILGRGVSRKRRSKLQVGSGDKELAHSEGGSHIEKPLQAEGHALKAGRVAPWAAVLDRASDGRGPLEGWAQVGRESSMGQMLQVWKPRHELPSNHQRATHKQNSFIMLHHVFFFFLF